MAQQDIFDGSFTLPLGKGGMFVPRHVLLLITSQLQTSWWWWWFFSF